MMPSGLDELAAQARHDFAHLNFPAANWVPATAAPTAGRCSTCLSSALACAGRPRPLRWRATACAIRASSIAPGAGGRAVGHLRAHGHAALAQAPHGARPRISLHSPFAPGTRRSTAPKAGSGCTRSERTTGWPTCCGFATRLVLRWRTTPRSRGSCRAPTACGVESTRTGRRRDTLRAQGRACGRSRRIGRRHTCRPSPRSIASGQHATGRVFHSSDDIDFARFKGGRIGILGASASAFDNAADRPGDGCCRGAPVRAPAASAAGQQIEMDRCFLDSFWAIATSTTRTRWQIYTYIFAEAVPPPHELVLRCDRHAGLRLAFRRALARRDPVAGRRHGRDRQGALCVRCRDPGHRISRSIWRGGRSWRASTTRYRCGPTACRRRRPAGTLRPRAFPISGPASS